MGRLYVTEPGSCVHRDGERLVVRKENLVLLDLAVRDVDAVVLESGAHVTMPALRLLLENGCDVAICTGRGDLVGRLVGRASRNVPLRMAQYEAYRDLARRTILARAVIAAKAANSAEVLRAWRANHPDDDIAAAENEIEQLASGLEAAELESICGLEGTIARIYFGQLDRMLLGDLRFERRSTRPPHNEVNALLSFTYTLVGNELTALLDAGGFDPYLGLFHALDYGRPSLALDLLEPFRAPVCDALVLRLLNLRMLRAEHFERRDGGVFLTKAAKSIYFREYERHLNRRRRGAASWRSVFRQQIDAAAAAIGKGAPWRLYRHETATLEDEDDAVRDRL